MNDREEISQEITDKVEGRIEVARELRRRGAYFWLIMVSYMIAGPAVAIWISSEGTHRSERKLCTIVINTDDYYHLNPPTLPAGKAQAANFSKLRRDLGCPPYKEAKP